MDLEVYVKEIRDDVKELKKEVVELKVAVAVEKEAARKSAVFISSAAGAFVSIFVVVIEKFL